ncbi:MULTISPECIES: type II secretion system protein [unclassified Campylobacter]|uniref:type II secretion system protein n=1 Tax=unclassified Campylobacter TaxID=2593542 RepID=UPI001237F7D2|nr:MULTISPECIES: type II secretion system protein [unclassified Campylobacter]KAA6224572.1 prepilin-type N-terminal cleavage/methylation domain-containing protein [Campylobacter sp. LR185c]KAA6224919.1 prepilin-type N-terminal cleavage/methylation domain-containing protein [Campylobacter sp. LR196d]KAA6225416.1 prepilin-type N-terminal cleavage/methylation domain-containing protein [Campylobacter sp. LR286c]KAA6229120.1 prepilin-type N-terminal cleavage/methylation domain-containing protein [Ca
MKRAFTVLELIFVIIILGVLATIALPKFDSSKDEAELSKALNNLKTLINDINVYALKNDSLAKISTMSNVSGVENVDLSLAYSDVGFKVGDDEKCISLVFVEKSDFVLMGISSNSSVKSAIEAVANGGDIQNLENADFTSTSKSKTCVLLSKNENFKALSSRTYVILGSMN